MYGRFPHWISIHWHDRYRKPAVAWWRMRRRASAATVGELVASIQEHCFWHLEAPIERIGGWDTPYPHAFEWQYFPGQKRLAAGIRKVMEAA